MLCESKQRSYFEAIRLVFYNCTRRYLSATNKRTGRMGSDIAAKFSIAKVFKFRLGTRLTTYRITCDE